MFSSVWETFGHFGDTVRRPFHNVRASAVVELPAMTLPDLEQLELYCGDASAIEARVRVRLPHSDPGKSRLMGHIVGPRCDFARTLPAKIPLRSGDASSGLKCEAVIPDPCLWTPQLPMLYDVYVELRQDGNLVATAQRPLAIRMFGPRGRDLNLAGKRWVLRGVRQGLAPAAPLSAWRETGAAMLLAELDEALALEAARQGVPLVAMVRKTTTAEVAAELRRLARCPAVMAAAINAAAPLPSDVGLAAIDIRLAAYCHAGDAPGQLPRWANMLLCESSDAAAIGRVANGHPYPVIALRPEDHAANLVAARRACDVLQRDLAPNADLAGYVV